MEFATDESRKGEREPHRAAAEPLIAEFRAAVPFGPGSEPLQIVVGNAGDHKLIFDLLRAANQAPSYDEFQASLDEPTYEPVDRLLIKLRGQIIAHVQVLDRHAWFDGVRLPVGGVCDLATLPEYREAGHERLLLATAEQTMRDNQAVIAFATTNRPEVFGPCGWLEVGSHGHTEANVADILALVGATSGPPSRRARGLKIRSWRQVELDGLRAVYRPSAVAGWGALDRSEPYWRWQVGRKAHDELIVAVRGKDRWEELGPSHIVGYAVTRGSQVVELVALPGFESATNWLLARACQDAIEADHRSLALLTPGSDPLHKQMLAAGGRWCANGRASVPSLMIKLLDPARWIEAIYPVLLRRAKASGLKRPFRARFALGRRTLRFDLTRRCSRLARDDSTAVDARCEPETLAALLLGNLDLAAARETGLLKICDDVIAERLAALFSADHIRAVAVRFAMQLRQFRLPTLQASNSPHSIGNSGGGVD